MNSAELNRPGIGQAAATPSAPMVKMEMSPTRAASTALAQTDNTMPKIRK